MDKDYYEILEVSPNASMDIIEAVYKRLAKRYHPDLQKEMPKSWAEDKMKELNLAYETLKDPFRREQYDALLMKIRNKTDIPKYRHLTGTIRETIKVTLIEIVKVTITKTNRESVSGTIGGPAKATIKGIIKGVRTRLGQRPNAVMKYRFLVVVPLVLLFGIIVLTVGFNSLNKRKTAFEQLPFNTIGSMGSNDEITHDETVVSGSISEMDRISEVVEFSKVPENKFTLGSPQSVVKDVMGVPTYSFLYSWNYGSSLIYFDENGRVDGWAKGDKSLKVWLGDKKKSAPPFKVGASKKEVIEAMGTPTSVFMESWGYGKSTVYFDENGKVKNWVEVDKHLRSLVPEEADGKGYQP